MDLAERSAEPGSATPLFDAHAGPFRHAAWKAARGQVLADIASGVSVALLGVSGVGKSLLLTDIFGTLAGTGRRVSLIRHADLEDEADVDVLLLDEADRLPADRLTALYRRPGCCVIAGLPGLTAAASELIPAPSTVTLAPLDPVDVGGFVVAHLLRTRTPGGGSPAEIEPAAIEALAAEAGCVPSGLQILTGLASFVAGLEGSGAIAERHVRAAVKLRYGVEDAESLAIENPGLALASAALPAIERAFPTELASVRPSSTAAARPPPGAIARPMPGRHALPARPVARAGGRRILRGLVFASVLAAIGGGAWFASRHNLLPPMRIAQTVPPITPDRPLPAPPASAPPASAPSASAPSASAPVPRATGAVLAGPAAPAAVPIVPATAPDAMAPAVPPVAAVPPAQLSVSLVPMAPAPPVMAAPQGAAAQAAISAPAATVTQGAAAAPRSEPAAMPDASVTPAGLPLAAARKILVTYPGRDPTAAVGIAARLIAQGFRVDTRARRTTEQGVLYFFAEDAAAARAIAASLGASAEGPAIIGGEARLSLRPTRITEVPPGTIEVALPPSAVP